MRRVLLSIVLLLLCVCQPVKAEKIQVTALSDLDVENPPETFVVKLNQSVALDNGKLIPKDSIIQNSVYKAKQSKRLKMKASLIIKVAKITEPNGNEYEIEDLYAKYTELIDKLNTSKEVAVGVANHFVKNITLPIHAIEGAIKNTEGNVAKSALKGAYDASPLSYIGKGETINITNGDTIYLDFDFYNPDDAGVVDKIKYR